MKDRIEIRVIPDAVPQGYVTGWFLQRKRRRFLFFHKWENLGWFGNYVDAVLAKTMYVPEEMPNKDTCCVGASGAVIKHDIH